MVVPADYCAGVNFLRRREETRVFYRATHVLSVSSPAQRGVGFERFDRVPVFGHGYVEKRHNVYGVFFAAFLQLRGALRKPVYLVWVEVAVAFFGRGRVHIAVHKEEAVHRLPARAQVYAIVAKTVVAAFVYKFLSGEKQTVFCGGKHFAHLRFRQIALGVVVPEYGRPRRV